MPFNSELGMRTFDPLAAYESGQPAAHVAAVAFERGQSQADKARQILKRNMAVEAMKIRAAELYSHMEQTPENQNLAQRQAFLEYAPGVYGEEHGLAEGINQLLRSDEANMVRERASEALQKSHENTLDLRRQIFTGNQELKQAQQQIDLLKETGRDIRATEREQRLQEKSDWERMDKEQQRRLDEERERGRNIRSDADRALKEKDLELKKQKALANDLDLQRIDANLKDAQDLLAKKRTSPWLHPWTDAKGLESSIKDLEKQRRDRLNELGAGVSKETPKSEPSKKAPPIPADQLKVGAKYRLDNGRIGTYKGGDPESESSYEFEDEGGSG